MTAVFRPKSTLIWSEATLSTDGGCRGARVALRRWLVRRSCACVASGIESERYLRHLGASTVIMLPNVTAVPRRRIRGTSITSTRVVLAHVGDWSIRKGADRTAQVYYGLTDRLSAKGISVELLIAGHVRDVPLPESAVHLGYIASDCLWEDLQSRGAQFLILLSRVEHWGFVVAEAMASSIIPIVSSNVGSGADLLGGATQRLIVDSPDAAIRVVEELHRDPDERARLGASLHSIEGCRTSDWAVGIFSQGLRQVAKRSEKAR